MKAIAATEMRPEPTAFQRSLEFERIYVKGGSDGQHGDADRLRIMSWNIERGHVPERLTKTLVAIRPDIACLQEVDWGNERTGSADVLEFLARETGMQGLFGIEFLELPTPCRGARLAGGGVTGNALLTRLEPAATFRVELPQSLNWQEANAGVLPHSVRRILQRETRIGRRFGLGADFQIGDRKLRVCSLHLEDKLGGVAGRWAQYLAAVVALEAGVGETLARVIAGDFNTFDSRLARLRTPDNNATALGKPAGVTEAAWWQTALLPRTGYFDPFTDSAWTFAVPPFFRAKLDWITTKGCEIRNFGVGSFSSSDHRPIWVDLYFPNA
jgi:endonuclease/exonuclease/phosphatase family metal-dependent hydrolase